MKPPACSMLYVLDEAGEPVGCPNVLEWSAWMAGTHQRILAKDKVGGYDVSTVFLGLDHGWGRGAPVLWETMLFGKGAHSRHCDRYTSREAALAGHAAWVDRLAFGVSETAPEEKTEGR